MPPNARTWQVSGRPEVMARVGGVKRKMFNASYWASEVGPGNWGWRVVNGSCGGGPFVLGPHARKSCEEMFVDMDLSSGVFETPEWIVEIMSRPVYDRISGPKTRLDLRIKPKVDEAVMRVAPHGIVGQSFDQDEYAIDGRVDKYPTRGNFTTSALAEGAI